MSVWWQRVWKLGQVQLRAGHLDPEGVVYVDDVAAAVIRALCFNVLRNKNCHIVMLFYTRVTIVTILSMFLCFNKQVCDLPIAKFTCGTKVQCVPIGMYLMV